MARMPGRASLSGLQSGAPAHAGPRLMFDTTLRLERRLPLPGTVEVREGQHVGPDTVIATAPNTPSRLHVIDIAKELDQQGRAEDMRYTVLVKPGQPVYTGEVVVRAPRPGWFERDELEVVSPVSGIVEFVSVGRSQVVVRTNSEVAQDRIALPVSSMLSIEPAELPSAAVCRPGQVVEPGDLLAKVSGFRPMSGEYRSPIGGIVESISPLSGVITVVRERKPLTLRAALDGWVERVFPGYGAAISARGHRVLGVLGLGGKSWGPLFCLPGPSEVTAALAGQVVALPGPVDGEFLQACRRGGVRGVIAGSTGARELEGFLGRPLAAEIVTGPATLAHGGDEAGLGTGLFDDDTSDRGMTVIITEGFGRLQMDGLTWQLLQDHEGTIVSLDGLTQIRAGVVRPSVMVPVGAAAASDEQAAGAAGRPVAASSPPAGAEPEALRAGQRVRIVRHPYFGFYGVVVEPPSGLTRLETEVEARVLIIQLDDGRRVKVAEANVEY